MTVSEAVALELVDAGGRPSGSEPWEVQALVWAQDEEQADKAVDFLRHQLWPWWFLFRIGQVRRLPYGRACPLREEDPAVLAYVSRARWMWVLVPAATDVRAVVSCM